MSLVEANEWFDQPNELVSRSEVVKIPVEQKPELFIALWKVPYHTSAGMNRVYGDSNDLYYAYSDIQVYEYLSEKANTRVGIVQNTLEIVRLGDVIDLTRTLKDETNNL